MTSRETRIALKTALAQFSKPFQTEYEVRAVPVRFDAIVALLLATDRVNRELGPRRVASLSKEAPDLSDLLREIDDPAAESAHKLLEIGRSSVGNFDDVDQLIAAANEARQRFYQACGDLLP